MKVWIAIHLDFPKSQGYLDYKEMRHPGGGGVTGNCEEKPLWSRRMGRGFSVVTYRSSIEQRVRLALVRPFD